MVGGRNLHPWLCTVEAVIQSTVKVFLCGRLKKLYLIVPFDTGTSLLFPIHSHMHLDAVMRCKSLSKS